MAPTRSTLYAGAIILCAGLLHAYEQFAKSASPSVGWFLWSMAPYAICLLVLFRSRSGIPAAFGATFPLLLDLVANYDVFVNPTGSTAALALLFVPLWNTLIVAPVAMLLAWLAIRRRARQTTHAA